MQNKQQNYNLMLLTAFFGVAVISEALAGGPIARPQPSQPMLRDGGSGPCDPGLDAPDMIAGVDVGGHPVPAAGMRAPVPIPDQILVPRKKDRRRGRAGDAPMVALDGRTLDPLLNPLPACPPGKR
jgi:hypothetical protein